MGSAMYHAHAAGACRQGFTLARDGCERGPGCAGIARRAWLWRVVQAGMVLLCYNVTPLPGIEPGGGVGVCT